jgi:MFS family permease
LSLDPQAKIDAQDLNKALRWLTIEGSLTTVMGSLTGGAFLVAFALMLGASNTAIGIIAAAAPLSQVLQIPTIFLIEKIRRRKRIVVISSTLARLFLLSSAFMPWFPIPELRLPLFVLALFTYYALASISGCAWNAWMRDLIPDEIMGRFFGKRLAVSTAFAALLSLGGGVLLDHQFFEPTGGNIYAFLFLFGSLAGLFGVYYLKRTPEPIMQPHSVERLLPLLKLPFRDQNYRRLIVFLAVWNFAINLAAPFYTVYMIKVLDMKLSWIIGLSVLSQGINVLFFHIWGKLADRFSNKSCLTVAGPLFIIGIGIWPFLTLPDKYALTYPLLIGIHLLSGISTAGVTLCSSNIALKSAPQGQATIFLATNALVNGIAASVAPILAGPLADILADEELRFQISWRSIAMDSDRFGISAISLQGTDFLFVLAFWVGVYAIHRLLAVTEQGDVEEKVVIAELYNETRHALRSVANIAGIRHLTYFPYAIVLGALDQSRKSIRHIRMRVHSRRSRAPHVKPHHHHTPHT